MRGVLVRDGGSMEAETADRRWAIEEDGGIGDGIGGSDDDDEEEGYEAVVVGREVSLREGGRLGNSGVLVWTGYSDSC